MKKINADRSKYALLGPDQEGLMEGLLGAISLREEECLTYDFPVYEGDKVVLEVEGSRGYSGRLILDDNGWKEEVL